MNAPLRVMQSFRAPRPTTNPYITMLDSALGETPGMEHLRFDWREALFGRYDVFQWHWPEGKLQGATWWKTAGKHALVGALMLRHRFSKIAVVRTVHNIELPTVNPVTRQMLKYIDAHTDYRITLNTTTPLPDGTPHTMILHGDYRDWFAQYPHSEAVTGQLGYFGGIRGYKSVDGLLAAYADAVSVNDSLSLRIGGRPSSPALAATVREQADALPRVELKLAFLSDAELVEIATSSQLVVLAYGFMHNSGSVLAALSLDTPVLVPNNEANRALAAEVGEEWVLTFDGTLDAAQLLEALATVSAQPRGSRPDLSQRGWAEAGLAHLEAYQRAVRFVSKAERPLPVGEEHGAHAGAKTPTNTEIETADRD